MEQITGHGRTIYQLLSGRKFEIDYYQREYKWGEKQVQELIQDLSLKFLENFEPTHEPEKVAEYKHYFLGSIIISRKNAVDYIVDGQQRLTTITLLLIYLNNLQKDSGQRVAIDSLIFSEMYRKKSFNLNDEERTNCVSALYEDKAFDQTGQPESVQNIIARYETIRSSFPEELTKGALPFFIDWLIQNVHLVEIIAASDEDAYTIFETMNDRGLSLAPTDMLKGYLLSRIGVGEKRTIANDIWKKRVSLLNDIGKEETSDCIKNWVRSQYAQSIRERKKGARPEDFDRIGTEFHRWVREKEEDIGLTTDQDFFTFIERDFQSYSQQYISFRNAEMNLTKDLESIYFNAQNGFTLQMILLLAPLTPDDSPDVVQLKARIVSKFIDILITRRIWNWHSITYSTMQYATFIVMRDIRRKSPEELVRILRQRLDAEHEVFSSNDRYSVHQQNRRLVHLILARMIDFIERESGMPSRYLEYVNVNVPPKNRFEVEHIWAKKPERHVDDFPHANDFLEYRNRIGGLLLLPKDINDSVGEKPYDYKQKRVYGSQNILARSLTEGCYKSNPKFIQFIQQYALPMHAHPSYKKSDLDERQDLYRRLAELIWNPDQLDECLTGNGNGA